MTALSVSLDTYSQTFVLSGSVTIVGTASGGTGPYTYQWYKNGSTFAGKTTATLTYTPTESDSLTLKVTDNTTAYVFSLESLVIESALGYCIPSDIKDRMLIASSDTTYDTAIVAAATEASNLIDLMLTPYEVTLPLTSVPVLLSEITADFAASIFKRQYMPKEVSMKGQLQPDQMQQIEASGWFAQGLKKMDLYIKNNYIVGLKGESFQTANVTHNPDLFITLFKMGIINAQEARKQMAASSQNAINELSTIEKNVVTTLTDTQTLTKTDIEDKYHHTRQHSFGFISASDEDDDDDYEVNSQDTDEQ